MKVKISEVCEQIRGVSYKPSDVLDSLTGIPILRANNISDGTINYDNLVYIKKERISSKQILKKGDILICTSSGSKNLVGKAGLIEKDILISSFGAFCRVLRAHDISSEYLFHYFCSNAYKNRISSLSEGANINNIKNEHINVLEIPIYPLEEEKKLLKVLNVIKSLILKRKQQLTKLNELAKSRFIEMFGDPVLNDKNWETKKIADVAPVRNYNGVIENKVWLLNLDMVESQSGEIIDYLYVEKSTLGSSICSFDESNVLYSKLRPYLNKVILPKYKGVATSELLPLRPKKELDRFFLAHLLRSDSFVEYISNKVAGSKMPRVSMVDFRNFDCILPPIEFQISYKKYIQQLDKSKFRIKKSLEKLEMTYKALLQEYFG